MEATLLNVSSRRGRHADRCVLIALLMAHGGSWPAGRPAGRSVGWSVVASRLVIDSGTCVCGTSLNAHTSQVDTTAGAGRERGLGRGRGRRR
ncbi:unnamed protein product [Soboliphyme baturini]|uniref:Secreted protein n=1 Tax=Soboliphyme baturini TaxID=241478 RepID=A0A183IF66_9BILA|nr:unnamed protein product [Soboliphyme baturini]